jgi:hypothetical protein
VNNPTPDHARMFEGASVAVDTQVHDEQVWHCHTKLEKVWIPKGLKKATLGDLQDLEQMQLRYGIGRVSDGETLRNIGEMQSEILRSAGVEPDLVEIDGNLLVYGGASCQWQTLIGNGTTTADQALTYFNNARAAIGVGDSSTAAAATQTNLQAATNKLRVAMDATYPLHTDGTTSGAASIQFKSTYSTGQANFAWQEWGIFNATTDGNGRMLNRKVESLGTKTSASTWALTLTLSMA